jgi:hypothetical protein
MIEFTNPIMSERAVQSIYMQVPTFQDSRCQGSGMHIKTKPMKEKAEYAWFMATPS